jgi:hypothetical protein
MPLMGGPSKKAFEGNVSELIKAFKAKGKIGTSTPKNKEKARKQALAIAFSKQRGE